MGRPVSGLCSLTCVCGGVELGEAGCRRDRVTFPWGFAEFQNTLLMVPAIKDLEQV